MRILDSKADILNAQHQLKHAFKLQKPQIMPTTIGYQSGNYDADVLWLPSLGYWAYFGMPPNEKSPGERYWNVFGIGKPSVSVNIICEINPPLQGINRRVSGVFARGENDVALLHRGRLNIRGGITKEFFQQNYRGKWIQVHEGEKTSSLVYIADLSSPLLCERIRDFVREVERIKQLARE